MFETLTAIARHLRRELRARRELRTLLEHDDRMLRDIGLTRADVEAALSRPLGTGARAEAYRLARHSLTLDKVF